MPQLRRYCCSGICFELLLPSYPRQQRDDGLLDALGQAKSVPSDPIQKKVQPECPCNMPRDAENSSATDARI
jgi:hypothetical protein